MKVAVVYWSGTGNTEMMAKAVAEGAEKAGAEVDIFTSDKFSKELLAKYDRVAFGCPAMGDEVLEPDEFEPMFSSLESGLSGKKIVLFGSYDWGDGEWMRIWEDRVRSDGAKMTDEGLIVNGPPGRDDLIDCQELGEGLVMA